MEHLSSLSVTSKYVLHLCTASQFATPLSALRIAALLVCCSVKGATSASITEEPVTDNADNQTQWTMHSDLSQVTPQIFNETRRKLGSSQICAIYTCCRGSKKLYDVHGVRREASVQDIKSVYRKLPRQFHPDTARGKNNSTEMFLQIHNVYATLSKPEDRAQYDHQLGFQQIRSRTNR